MRLQLIATVTAAFAIGTLPAAAQPTVSVDARAAVYDDSDDTTVISSTVAARGNVADTYAIKARYLVDIISTASVDVVSAATQPFEELRHEIEAALSYQKDAHGLQASYVYSVEPDWQSNTLAAGASGTVANGQLALGVATTLVLDEIGRIDDPTFEQQLTSLSWQLSATLVASPYDLLSVAYSFSHLLGYQASPYRYAFFSGTMGSRPIRGPAERHPNRRLRHALSLRHNRHLFKSSALRSHVRGYVDNWGVASVTAASEYVVGFGPVDLAARVRGYLQSRASFYEATYTEAKLLMTADRELSPFVDGFVGMRASWRQHTIGPFYQLKADLRIDGFAFRYFDFPFLASRTGVVAELGLGASF